MTDEPAARDLDLRTVRIIRAIEQTGSITAASKQLGYSQPAVSQHIQRAETRLGMQLVIRSGRTARLSEAGLVVDAIADDVLGAVDGALDRLRGLSQLKSGTIALSGFPSASSTLVPALLSSLRASRPGLSLTYTEAEPPESFAMLADGRVDIALVCRYPHGPLDDEWLRRHRIEVVDLFVDPIQVILPHDHPLAGEEPAHLLEMEDDEWIAGCPRCREHLVQACRAVGFEPAVSMETDNFSAVVGLVAAGLGVAALPRLSLGTAAVPDDVVVRGTDPQGFRTIGFAVREEAASVPAVRATIAALRSLDGGPWRLTRPGASGTVDAQGH